jgi:hypothetical protein
VSRNRVAPAIFPEKSSESVPESTAPTGLAQRATRHALSAQFNQSGKFTVTRILAQDNLIMECNHD